MELIRKLLEEAQGLFKDMSRTQHATVGALIVSVTFALIIVVVMGSRVEDIGRVPLPIEVEAANVKEIQNTLSAAGIEPAEYREGRIWVDREQEQDAILLLAENSMLPDDTGPLFDEMLQRWDFTVTGQQSDAMMLLARQNAMALMIERLDPIKDAQVIYSGEERKYLFGPKNRERAAVKVTTKLGRELDQGTADTIVALVAAAKTGLDEQDVVVTDQRGHHFRSRDRNSLYERAMKQLNLEGQRRDELVDRVERLCLAAIPGCQAWAFVDVRVNMDEIRRHKEDYEDGPKTRSRSEKYETESISEPPAETGTRPNIATASAMGSGGNREVETSSRKLSDVDYQNDVEVTDTRVAPKIEHITVSSIVQMPYKYVLETDEQGNPIEGQYVTLTDYQGNTLVDEMGRPVRKRVPDPEKMLQGEALAKLERQIELAVGRLAGMEGVEIDILQVPYPENQEVGTVPVASTTLALEWASEHWATILLLCVLSCLIYVAYSQASRALPSEEVDLNEEEALALSMVPEMSEADQVHANFEAMRNKLSDLISENPRKSAQLVRKWMTRDSY